MIEGKKDITVKVDSNIHHLAGEDLLAKDDPRFKEYRKNWKLWPETFYVGRFPLFIDIETTSVCNLKCPFCPATFRRDKIKNGFLKPDIVKKVIDEGADKNLYGIKFNMRGEPLLHPDIDKFVRYAKRKGLIDVYFNTNATLLTEEMIRRLIDAGLDRLCISAEGHTKDVYEKHRVGADFETVLRNVDNINILKKKLGVKHPKVRIQAVMTSDIWPGLEKYKDFWSVRADEVAFLDHRDTAVKASGIEYPWACPQLWQRFAIWWDGTMFACNQDEDGLNALGNARDMTVQEAWHSQKLNGIRRSHKNGMAHTIAACDICCTRDNEINKLKGRL